MDAIADAGAARAWRYAQVRCSQRVTNLPILYLNCSSSSLPAAMIARDAGHVLGVRLKDPPDIAGAVNGALDTLLARGERAAGFAAVGHRVVAAGEQVINSTSIDAEV